MPFNLSKWQRFQWNLWITGAFAWARQFDNDELLIGESTMAKSSTSYSELIRFAPENHQQIETLLQHVTTSPQATMPRDVRIPIRVRCTWRCVARDRQSLASERAAKGGDVLGDCALPAKYGASSHQNIRPCSHNLSRVCGSDPPVYL